MNAIIDVAKQMSEWPRDDLSLGTLCFLRNAPIDWLRRQITDGFTAAAQDILGHTQFESVLLDAIPRPIIDHLDNILVYVDCVRRPNILPLLYGGGGTAAPAGWKRLDGHAGMVDGTRKAYNIHEKALQQLGIMPKFSIVWSSARANRSPVLPLVVEGLLQVHFDVCTLEPSLPKTEELFVSDSLGRLVRDFGANVNPDLVFELTTSLLPIAHCV
ncbi:uncharacterized protein LTR77_008267 [Saxophila tyrrhenica]|uniref:Uncharacterized protein n=1 Tax=Saxophila tyrrhenica TaxID=1690608 RepID=A0AAV9P5P5_9PEZI|nr:hypothetical protein LTR77_008267 [Saxophila tyrrhenica]